MSRNRKHASPLFGSGAQKFTLTKLDVAEAHIKTAVRLFFEGGHPVSIYTLANAAREIVAVMVSCLAFSRISDAPLKQQSLLRKAVKQFPGLRCASRIDQKGIGNEVLQKCLRDPSLEMTFSREVQIPEARK